MSNEDQDRWSRARHAQAPADRETTFLLQEAEAERSVASANATLYAWRDGDRIGALEFCRCDAQIRINVIYVAPHCRGQGVGAALVRSLALHFPLETYRWEPPTVSQPGLKELLVKAFAVG